MGARKKPTSTVSYEKELFEDLQDSEFVAAYLSACIHPNEKNEDDLNVLWGALQNVIRAQGLTAVAGKTGLTRDALYKIFTDHRNPTIRSFRKLLHAINLEISFTPRQRD